MTPEGIVGAVILAVILLINLLGRLLGPGHEEERETAPRLEPQRPLLGRPESRFPPSPQRKPSQQRRSPSPPTPQRPVASTRLSAARRLGLTEPRTLRRAVVLMTLLEPCRSLDPEGGRIWRY
ncbi:MAG TPA: hypothetical protein VLE25_14475 [Nitrospira sp.]|nr:hypothetical protein [Nitrospira sp.]